MYDQDKITLSQWNQLSSAKKEKLKIWALNHGYELDIIPSASGSFDPACDYAALLTREQLIEYMNQYEKKIDKNDRKLCEILWNKIVNEN